MHSLGILTRERFERVLSKSELKLTFDDVEKIVDAAAGEIFIPYVCFQE